MAVAGIVDDRRDVAAVRHDDRRGPRCEDLVEDMADFLAGLALRPGKLRRAHDLQAARMDQVEVANQIGRPDLVVGDGDDRIETAADQLQAELLVVSVKQPR